MSDRFLSLTHLRLRYPDGLPISVVDAVQAVDKLLNSEWFTDTFAVNRPNSEILDAVKDLRVYICDTATYNAGVLAATHTLPDVMVTDEMGWFDARLDDETIYLNAEYFTPRPYNSRGILPVLAMVTVVHELQHFLHYNFNVPSPIHPIPSMRTKDPVESGHEWEIRNLGGVLGRASFDKTPKTVRFLLHSVEAIENGTRTHYYPD
ncbi:uncharacterized protein SPPG_06413 [Spizellomyces punctatus DAOM BR117]|uniref:Uncharacterized protein n=1 Tax=Spizellomyces punctatus (strain DAOM BR117) TaxID=645134 RepID=A0A0L0H8Y3_SPIPD|nr:uncharacterized protein SPPG_06413 [Spizellomyces punctatus DAOM BR117]KNC97995.1 hypothetical protein SPPG_06413 [Spizellomyces punctatus DAOM BR117]|eukprot:XP_016606035.1 hypothetical protein SPPG_06413 [Spizellomyces punctatus DAOM BR117]